jgi:formate dehydrogenase subunit delta
VNADKLVRMANQIAANFEYEPDTEAAAEKVADHLRRFWDPMMRAEIIDYLQTDGAELSEIAQRAVSKLAERYV